MTAAGVKRVRGDAALEQFVFGASSDSEGDAGSDNELAVPLASKGGISFGASDSETEEKAEVGAAWQDPDDEKLTVGLEAKNSRKRLKQTNAEEVVSGKEFQQRLRDNFEKIKGKSNWATKAQAPDSDSDDEEAQALLRASGAGIASSKGGNLPPSILNYEILEDANRQERSKCLASCVKFHPNSELLAVAGIDKHLRLFHIDGEENAKLASYYFERFPITSTAFINQGKEMILTGQRHHSFYSYDVESGQSHKITSLCGRKSEVYSNVTTNFNGSTDLKSSRLFAVQGQNGNIHLVDQKTKHLVRSVKVTGDTTALAFHPTKDVLYAATKQSMIYEWDVATGRCIQKVHDLSAVNISSLAVSPASGSNSNVVLAAGTSSGTVDLFDITDGLEKNQNPFKSLMNLQTNVSTVAFNPNGEALFAASSDMPDAVKIWQRPTYQAFQNFPAPRKQKSVMSHVQSVDFSSKNGLVAMGNDAGRVLLYSLSHYA